MKKKSMKMAVFLLLILVIGKVAGAENNFVQAFLREPFDQIAAVGEHVTLPCRVVNKRGVLQWTRDDFGLGTDRNLTGFKRYRMSGSDEEGDWTLDINPVGLEDDARFQCQVGASEGVAPIRSRYATLTVLVQPEPPRLLPNGDLHKTVEGRQVELRCESRGGKPASEITWLDDRGLVLTDGVRTVQELMEDGKRYITVSILRFVATTDHHGRNFTCQAQNSANRQPKSVSTSLQVHYPPHVKLTSDKGDLLQEGDRVRFSCSASANPAQVTYAWYVGGRRVADAPEASTELVLDHIDRRLHNHLVRCEVTNPIGRSEETTVLNIAYEPVFVTRPINMAGMVGEKIILACLVDANPHPSYTWYRLDPKERIVVGNAPNLTIEVRNESAGDYECVASSKSGHYSPIQSIATVYVKSRPKISTENRIQFSPLKDTGKIVCEAVSVPTVDDVEWLIDGQTIVTSDGTGRYSVQENRSRDSVRSTLIIRRTTPADFREYTCRVNNVLGTDVAVFQLLKQAKVSLTIILSGAIGGLIITVAIILIVVLCRRTLGTQGGCNPGKIGSDIVVISKNMKTADDGSGSGSNNGCDGVSNNSSELKVEVRTSSSLSQAEDCWEGSDDSAQPFNTGPQPKTHHLAVPYTNVDPALPPQPPTLTGATLPPYNKAADTLLTAPKYMPQQNGGSSNYGGGYYHTNTAAAGFNNYGNYNHAYTSSPSQMTGGSTSSSNGSHGSTGYKPPNVKSLENLYSTQVHGGLNIDKQMQQRYSVHVRASPISPTYSQFSTGVKTYSGSQPYANGYGGGGLKNASFDYVPSEQLRQMNNYRYSASQVPDNYAVYVNSTSSPMPSIGVHDPSLSATDQSPTHSANSVKVGSLATHV